MAIFSPSAAAEIIPYKFSVYRTAAQTLTSGTATKINFDTKAFDTGSNFDATTNFNFTAPIAGFYHFDSRVGISTVTGLTRAFISIYKNSAEYKRGADISAGNQIYGLTVSGFMQLAANDTVDIRVNPLSGAAPLDVATTITNYFDGYLAGSA